MADAGGLEFTIVAPDATLAVCAETRGELASWITVVSTHLTLLRGPACKHGMLRFGPKNDRQLSVAAGKAARSQWENTFAVLDPAGGTVVAFKHASLTAASPDGKITGVAHVLRRYVLSSLTA